MRRFSTFKQSKSDIEGSCRLISIFSAIISLLLAVWIYLTQRPSSVFLNVKFDQIIGPEFRWFIGRSTVDPAWPNWIIDSLPAALWLYATNVIIIKFYPQAHKKNPLVIMLVMFCVLTELFQYLSIIPGTFDKMDVLLYIAFGLTPMACHEKICNKN